MKLSFKVLSVTASKAEEVVRLVPVLPERGAAAAAEAVGVQRGSGVTIIIKDDLQRGQFRHEQLVNLEVTTA